MKKFFAAAVALVMLFALCVPAFAGTAIDALTDPNAKELASAIAQYLDANPVESFVDQTLREQMIASAIPNITAKNFDTEEKRVAAVDGAIAALQADYPDRLLTEENAQAFKAELLPKLEKAYNDSQLGISTFDPSQVVDNVADGFSDGDLDALFDTMRNTINDLSDRLTGAFNTVTGGTSNNDSGNSSTDQPEFGGSDATGDTAIFAVIGVAAVAGAALVLTRKKAK